MHIFMLTFIFYCIEDIQYTFKKNLITKRKNAAGTFKNLEMREIFNVEK